MLMPTDGSGPTDGKAACFVEISMRASCYVLDAPTVLKNKSVGPRCHRWAKWAPDILGVILSEAKKLAS
jgi:hypothetical protein